MYIHSLKNFKTKSIQLGKPEILPPSSDLINRLREINKEQLDTPPTIEPEQEIETNHTEKINELKQRRDHIDEKKRLHYQFRRRKASHQYHYLSRRNKQRRGNLGQEREHSKQKT